MLTEPTLRDYPNLVKALTGLPAETFWVVIDAVTAHYPAYERQRYTRTSDSVRPLGGDPVTCPW